MPKTSSSMPQNLTRTNPGAAAIDIGSTMHVAAINPDCADVPIRSFGTFTHDLHDLAAWFKSYGVTSVAMESTGVYWIPAFEILEQLSYCLTYFCYRLPHWRCYLPAATLRAPGSEARSL